MGDHKRRIEAKSEMPYDTCIFRTIFNLSKGLYAAKNIQPDSKPNTSKDGFIYNIGDPPSFFSSQKEYLLIVFKNEHVEEVTLAVE